MSEMVLPNRMTTRELDAWLAEHLLGYRWRKSIHGNHCRGLVPPDGPDANWADGQTVEADGTEPLAFDAYRFIPNLSTTGDGMLRVIAEMAAQGRQFSVLDWGDDGIDGHRYQVCFWSLGGGPATIGCNVLPTGVALAAKAALEGEGA